MTDKWYNEFMDSTGFAVKQKIPESVSKTGSKEREFIQQYQGSDSQPPPPKLGVPGTITGPGAIISGTLPTQDSNAPNNQPFREPYPNSNVLLNKDGIKPVYPTEQKDWQAVGIGPNVAPSSQLNAPASKAIPNSKPSGGFKVEWMKGSSENRNVNYAYAASGFGALAVLSGGAFALKKGNKYEKQYGGVAALSTVIAFILLGLYYSSSSEEPNGAENQLAGYLPDQRKVLQDTNFAPPIYPLQRDQQTPKVYQSVGDAENNVQDRYNSQGLDTNSLEGPRENTGYRRSMPTPDGRKTLAASELMRSPGNSNMDDGTFHEYMRRMNGEAPSQLVKSHPYYTFNAEWDHRSQIDDSDKFYGITDEPSQMLRKSLYRNPKIQQAGAKRMHLKDPPPGSVQPLQKVHPMMERDTEATGPAFFAGPGEKMMGSTNQQPIFDEIQIPDMNHEDKIVNAQDLMKERMSLNPAESLPSVDKDFLKPENVMSDRKRAMLTGQYAAPPERENLNMPPKPTHGPPETIDLNKGRIMPDHQPPAPIETQKAPEKMDLNNSIHSSPEENQPVNQENPSVAEDSEHSFLSAFLEKTTPSQSVIDSALQSRRE